MITALASAEGSKLNPENRHQTKRHVATKRADAVIYNIDKTAKIAILRYPENKVPVNIFIYNFVGLLIV